MASNHITEKRKQKIKEQIRLVKEQINYMNKMISDLQVYARPLEPKLIETNLRNLIKDALSTMHIPEHVQVSVNFDESLLKLMIDPYLMKQAFTHLFMNALQAMPNGGKLTINASNKRNTATITIKDTGVGIPKKNLNIIFYPTFTTKAKGQGFGLTACKRIVEAHNGSIKVKSTVGKGTYITIELPLKKQKVK